MTSQCTPSLATHWDKTGLSQNSKKQTKQRSRRATSTWQDSDAQGHSFEDSIVLILDSMKEEWQKPTSVYCERSFLNRRGGLWHQLSATYNLVLRSFPRRLNAHSQLVSVDLNRSHDRERQVSQWLHRKALLIMTTSFFTPCMSRAVLRDKSHCCSH